MSGLTRYSLRLRSALGSPMKSDTLSGQLLCAYREKHGESALESLLEKIRQGELPFRLSDVFPRGYLPIPIFPPVPRRLFQSLADRHCQGDRYEALKRQKQRRKELKFLTESEWVNLRSNASLYSLLDDWLSRKPEMNWRTKTVAEMHNVIDRHLNQSLKSGGIFTVENTWVGNPKQQRNHLGTELIKMDLYAQVQTEFKDEFEDLLRRIGMTGFGRDASVGLGHFEVMEKVDASNLLELSGANCWLNLSTLSTTDGSAMDEGYCQLRAKFGKVWSGFGENAPFKKPILVADPGAILRRLPNESTMILQGVHPSNPKVIQYTAGLFLPFVLNETPES